MFGLIGGIINLALTILVFWGLYKLHQKLPWYGKFIFWVVILGVPFVISSFIDGIPPIKDEEGYKITKKLTNISESYELYLIISFVVSFVLCCVSRRRNTVLFECLCYIFPVTVIAIIVLQSLGITNYSFFTMFILFWFAVYWCNQDIKRFFWGELYGDYAKTLDIEEELDRGETFNLKEIDKLNESHRLIVFIYLAGIAAGIFRLFMIEGNSHASDYANPFYKLDNGGWAYFILSAMISTLGITIYMIKEDIKNNDYIYPANIFLFLSTNIFRFIYTYLFVGYFVACINNLWLFILFFPSILPFTNFVWDSPAVSKAKRLEVALEAARKKEEEARIRYNTSGNDYGGGSGYSGSSSSNNSYSSNHKKTGRNFFERESHRYGWQCYYYNPSNHGCRFQSGGGEYVKCDCVNRNAKLFCPYFMER